MAGWYNDADWDGLRIEYIAEILSDLFCALNERERLIGRGACTDAGTPWALAWTSYQDYEEGESRPRPAAQADEGEPFTKALLPNETETTDPEPSDFYGADAANIGANVARLRTGIELLLFLGHERFGSLTDGNLEVWDSRMEAPEFDTGYTAKFKRASGGVYNFPNGLAWALSDAGYAQSDWSGSVKSGLVVYEQLRDVLNVMTSVQYTLGQYGGYGGLLRGPCYMLNLADRYPDAITLKEGTGITLEDGWDAAVAASEVAVTVDTEEEEAYANMPALPAIQISGTTVKIWQMSASAEPAYHTEWVQGEIVSVIASISPVGDEGMPGALAFTDAYAQTWVWPDDIGETPSRGAAWPDVGVETPENPLRWDSLPGTCPMDTGTTSWMQFSSLVVVTDLEGELVFY